MEGRERKPGGWPEQHRQHSSDSTPAQRPQAPRDLQDGSQASFPNHHLPTRDSSSSSFIQLPPLSIERLAELRELSTEYVQRTKSLLSEARAAPDSSIYRTSFTPETFTKPFCQFLTENPTIFHAVDYFKEKLGDVGFVEASPSSLHSLSESSEAAGNP